MGLMVSKSTNVNMALNARQRRCVVRSPGVPGADPLPSHAVRRYLLPEGACHGFLMSIGASTS